MYWTEVRLNEGILRGTLNSTFRVTNSLLEPHVAACDLIPTFCKQRNNRTNKFRSNTNKEEHNYLNIHTALLFIINLFVASIVLINQSLKSRMITTYFIISFPACWLVVVVFCCFIRQHFSICLFVYLLARCMIDWLSVTMTGQFSLPGKLPDRVFLNEIF